MNFHANQKLNFFYNNFVREIKKKISGLLPPNLEIELVAKY